MEELGFAIAVPETLLCGFVILVVIGVIIVIMLRKIQRMAEQVEDTYNLIDTIDERQKRIEALLDKIATK